MHIQFPSFSYYDWDKQYSMDGGQVYSVCLTNFELGTTTFDGKAVLFGNHETPFNDMEVPDLCSVFDYKFTESIGSSIDTAIEEEEQYQELQKLYANHSTGTPLTLSVSQITDPTFVELNVSDSTIYDIDIDSDQWQSGDDRILDHGIETINDDISRSPIPYRAMTENGEIQQDVIYRDHMIDIKQLGQGRVDQYDQSGWIIPPKGQVTLPQALRRRQNGAMEGIQEYDNDAEFPRSNAMIFDNDFLESVGDHDGENENIAFPSPDARMERINALTEEEWNQVLKTYKDFKEESNGDERRAIGEQEWQEIVDSYHGHDHEEDVGEYPGRRLLQQQERV